MFAGRNTRSAAASAAALALCCGVAAGCAPKTAAHGSGTAALEMEDVHFYRRADQQTVYRVSKTVYCVVADPEQMNAFGGFSQVRVVTASVNFLRGKKPTTPGFCPSP